MSQFLIGPISIGDQVLVVYESSDKKLHALNSYPGPTGTTGPNPLIILDSNVVPLTSQMNSVPVFSVSGDGNNLILQGNNLGGLGFDTNNNAQLTINGSQFNPTQTQFTPWGPPYPVLSGVNYSLVNSNNVPIVFNLGSIDSQGTVTITGTTTTVQFLEVTWFFGCHNGNPGQENVDPGLSLLSAYCALNPSDSTCTGSDVIISGWTNLPDCQDGIRYTYCPNPNDCGISCKGPCSSSFDSCDYDFGNNGFECRFDPNKLFKGNWWEQPWFIATASVAGGLFILLILIAVIGYYRSK